METQLQKTRRSLATTIKMLEKQKNSASEFDNDYSRGYKDACRHALALLSQDLDLIDFRIEHELTTKL